MVASLGARPKHTQGKHKGGHEADTWRSKFGEAGIDTWRTRLGGAAKADSDSRWTQGRRKGHMADTRRTSCGDAAKAYRG